MANGLHRCLVLQHTYKRIFHYIPHSLGSEENYTKVSCRCLLIYILLGPFMTQTNPDTEYISHFSMRVANFRCMHSITRDPTTV